MHVPLLATGVRDSRPCSERTLEDVAKPVWIFKRTRLGSNDDISAPSCGNWIWRRAPQLRRAALRAANALRLPVRVLEAQRMPPTRRALPARLPVEHPKLCGWQLGSGALVAWDASATGCDSCISDIMRHSPGATGPISGKIQGLEWIMASTWRAEAAMTIFPLFPNFCAFAGRRAAAEKRARLPRPNIKAPAPLA